MGRSSIVLRRSCNWTEEERYFSPAAIVCWWSLPTPETLRRRKLRYCFTNWGTLSGVFLRTTIPGTADLSETLPKCRGIARARPARPHTTVPGAAPSPTIPAFNPGNSQVPPSLFLPVVVFFFPFPISQVGTNSSSLTPAPNVERSGELRGGAFEGRCTCTI